MEAWESSDRIRPLSPEASPNGPGSGPPRGPRGWTPLVIAVIAIGAFAVGSALLSRGQPGDSAATTTTTAPPTTVPDLAAEPPPPTTTTTLPPRLATRVPGLTDVRMIVSSGSESRFDVWRSFDRDAMTYDLPGRTGVAAFDVDGDLAATLDFDDPESPLGTLRVGNENSPFPARALFTSSFRWHESEPGRMAFIALLPLETELSLMHAVFDRVTGEVAALTRIAAADTGASLAGSLAAWGDWGFALNTTRELTYLVEGSATEFTGPAPRLVILGPEGNEIASTDGWLVDANDDGAMLVQQFWDNASTDEGGLPVLMDAARIIRTDASLVPNGSHDLLTPNSLAFLHPDGDVMTEVTVDSSAVTLVTSRTFDRQSNRSAVAPGFLDPIGFTQDGRYFILHDQTEQDIVFLNWSNGTQFRVPAGDVVYAAHAR